jgi:hypothetical protein
MKCNTKSSTETELVLLADKLSDIVWMQYFIECQGYNIDEYIIFQDSMNALSLEKNGHVLSSKWTKHIKVKYFLIKDYYDAGEIDVKFCPTDGMWADVLTKPLQGQKFRDMRALLQHCPRDYEDDTEQNKSMNPQDVASSWECVGEHDKNARGKVGQNKSPCCVSWADETQALSCKKTRQGPTPCHANMSLEGIQKQNHMAKPRGQKIQKIQEDAHVAKRYARNKGESNQVSTR